MEQRPNKLADLKLVAKYYPAPNYSYPRADPSAMPQYAYQRPQGLGRGSVGSDCSVPGMIPDDCESDVSVEDDYQYHVSGAELWDSFWQANSAAAAEKEKRKNGRAQKYPALIPSPALRRYRHRNAHVYVPDDNTDADSPGEEDPSTPLPQSPVRPKTPNATYSLFPQPRKTPTRPLHPPRKSSLCPTPPQDLRSQRGSNLSLPNIPRAKPAPFELFATSTATKSAPVSPVLKNPFSGEILPPSTHSDSAPTRPKTSRSHSHPTSPSSYASAIPPARGRSASAAASHHAPAYLTSQSATHLPLPRPPPFTMHSNMSSTFTAPSRPCQSPSYPRIDLACAPRIAPSPPRPREASPPRVSVFEDSDDEDTGNRGLSRRIARGFAAHKRSASETRRSAKGQEVARQTLRRARGATTAAPSTVPMAASTASGIEIANSSTEGREEKGKNKEAEFRPRLKRQQSGGLGGMFGRWSH